ncbi:putative TRAP-type C4-dicarboxylate transport system, periplasmic component [Vibrio nigripulchritudo SOn1]|uniref:TRAP-type C4-dicarboxylate transport system, periplasmic component n=1 Tax=Vibrio nigripulchritudo SOn1 TaxID=1238450 RepID=A0AAV2VMU7_9VIBR|nr:TRAP transporter substrate-binding protein [Vibrio nigripulchritudo]CCO45796.1 putative TRAP-type C4-dicarboxylate transport system, periplasmic component [Vibrio nigripulchritudo SOn1]
MNMKSTLLGGVLALSAAFSAAAETFVLVNADSIGSPMDEMNKHFAELLEQRSDGKIKVNYITGTQLGTPPQVMDQIASGSVDALGTAAAWLSSYAPDTQILTWGFTFRDGQHMFDFFDSELFQGLTEEMRTEDRIRVLSAGPTEPRIAYLVKPLGKDGAFTGRKMRIPQIQSYLELWGALGAQPTQVAWGEVYLAMSTGIVDGAEGPPTAAVAQRFHEVAPNIYLTNHVWATSTIVFNEDKFNSMSAEHQKLLVQAAKDASRWAYDDATNRREQVLSKMKAAGATINEYDSAPLREAALKAVGKVEDQGLWKKGLFEAVQKL